MQTFRLIEGASTEIEQTFELWLEHLHAWGASPKTLRNYRCEVGQFIRYLTLTLNLAAGDCTSARQKPAEVPYLREASEDRSTRKEPKNATTRG